MRSLREYLGHLGYAGGYRGLGEAEMTPSPAEAKLATTSSQELFNIIKASTSPYSPLTLVDACARVGLASQAISCCDSCLRMQDGPINLVQAGVGVLQRAGSQSVPLSWASFDDESIMVDEVDVTIPPHDDFSGAPLNDFPRREDLLRIAREAFGSAWLRYDDLMQLYLDQGEAGADTPTWQDTLGTLLALDGLRCVFEELHDSDGAAATRREFLTCAGNWPDSDWSLIEPIEINFRETEAFFRGLDVGGDGPTTVERVEDYLARQRSWQKQLKALASEIKDMAKSGDGSNAETLLDNFGHLVQVIMAGRPEEQVADAGRRAEQLVGEMWSRLPESAHQLLIEAQYLRAHIHSARLDFFPVIMAFARCVEILLRQLAPQFNQLCLDNQPQPSRRCEHTTIGEFLWTLRRKYRPCPQEIIALEPLREHLSDLNEIRTRAAHGQGQLMSIDDREIQDLLFAEPTKLFPRIAKIVLN